MGKFKPGDYVRSDSFRGIAMYVHDYAIRHNYDDETEDCEHTFYDDIYECVMIGDDQGHVIHEDDLQHLPPDLFCLSCGQIGCGWHTAEGE